MTLRFDPGVLPQGLGDTVKQLVSLRKLRLPTTADPATVLHETASFGSNPGALRMLSSVPAGLPPGAPLVVELHGCTQTAAAYDSGAGWSTLGARHGFAVLAPEQSRANNPNVCFNWFQPADVARHGGEAESIAQMIVHMLREHRLHPARVYVTGLSAGGAMTASMLATYPELFAGGAIIAGLPHGAADGVPAAFEAMGGRRVRPAREWGGLVRAASPHRGPWPAVQIWQGGADHTVRPANADELIKQWTDVHGLQAEPHTRDTVDGALHELWHDAAGRTVLESYTVPGLAHGTPLQTGAPDLDHAAGHAGPHMLEAGIASTWHIAQSWGLLTRAAQERVANDTPAPSAGPLSMIDKALRAAGLVH